MNLLAIDTSSDYLSLAVIKNGKISSRLHRKTSMSHSSLLVPAIDRILKRSKLNPKEISAFSISIGPGSFTGLRIGVATVKGLAVALKKTIVTVPTLDAIAYNAKSFKGVICPVLDARKKKVYACLYKSDGKNLKKISRYLLLPPSDLLKKTKKIKHDILYLGNGVSILGAPEIASWHPRAEVIAELGMNEFRKRRFVKPQDLEPLYLYSKECDVTGK